MEFTAYIHLKGLLAILSGRIDSRRLSGFFEAALLEHLLAVCMHSLAGCIRIPLVHLRCSLTLLSTPARTPSCNPAVYGGQARYRAAVSAPSLGEAQKMWKGHEFLLTALVMA